MTLEERLKRAENGRRIAYKGADGSVTYLGDDNRPLPTAPDSSLENQRIAEQLGAQQKNEAGLQDWAEEMNQFLAQSQEEKKRRSGTWQDEAALGEYRKQQDAAISRLQQQANQYASFFSANRGVYGDKVTDSVLNMLDRGGRRLARAHEQPGEVEKFQGQFLDQDEFDTYQRLTTADAEELKAWNDELNAERDEITARYRTTGDGETYLDDIRKVQQVQNRVLNRYYELDNQQKLTELEGDPAAKALYQTANAKAGDAGDMLQRMRDRLDRGGRPEEDPDAMATIERVYGLSPEKSGSLAQYMNDLQSISGMPLEETEALAGMGYDYGRLSGYQQTQRDKARYEQEQARTMQTARKHPFLTSGASVLAAPFQGVDYMDMAIRSLTGGGEGDIENYVPLNVYNMGATNYVSGVRGAVSEKIAENTQGAELFGVNLPSFAYQTGMSVLDSAAQVAALGGASLPVMGAAAAAGEMQDIIARGGSNQQALMGGTAAGIAEVLFEKLSIDNLLKPKSVTGWKSLVKETAKQAGVEASEETFTEIANILSDAAIMGRDSSSALAEREYMLSGMSQEEARKRVFLDHIGQVAEAGAGGFFSGIGMGGTSSAVNYALGGGQYNSLEPMQYQDRADPLVQAAREMAAAETPQTGIREAAQVPAAQPMQKNYTQETGTAQEVPQSAVEVIQRPQADTAVQQRTQVDTAGQQRTQPDTAGQQRAAMQNASALAQAAEAFGANGQKAFAAAWDGQQSADRYYAGFSTWYQAGLTGKAQNQVRGPYAGSISQDQQFAAYAAGQNDAAASLEREKAAAPYARTAGTEAGLYDAGELNADTAGRMDATAKLLGTRVYMVDNVAEGRANGQYSGSDILIAKDAVNPEAQVFGHEITHRVQELAPEVYRVFRQAAMDHMADSAARAKINDYQAQGMIIQYEAAMDDVAADYAGQLMEDGAVLDEFIDRHRTDRTLLERLRDAFRALWQKLTGAERRKAQTAEGKLSAALDAAAEQAKTLNQGKNSALDGEGGQGGEGEVKYSLKEYDGKDLSKDGSVYTYDFLTSLPDMRVTTLPEVGAVRDSGGKVDARAVVDQGMKNARAVGTERDGNVFVRNRYTGKQLQITGESIRHGLNGGLNRLLTNARLGAMIGDLAQNAVPINALQDKAQGVAGTYAMAGYATDSAGREFVAILTVEQRTGRVVDLEAYDMLHAVSGRQKKSSQASTKLQGLYPIKAADITIADFLEAVNSTHQSILPQNVLDHFGETRNPKGDYTDDVKFSLKGATITKSYNQILRENDALRERVEYWRNQTRRTKEVTVDKKAVDKAARDILKRYGADLDAGELSGRLKALYDSLAGIHYGRGETENSDVWKGAEEIARDIAESAVAEYSLSDEFPGLRDKLKTTPITIGHEYDNDIHNEKFRTQYRGKLKLSSQGPTNVDAVYAELSESYPGLFPADITHPADQLEQIMDVADSLATVERHGTFDGQMDAAVTGITNEIMEQFLGLDLTAATFADRQAAKLDQLREENRQAVKNAIARERAAREKQVTELKKKYKAKTEEGRERQRAGELRQKITRHTKALSEKLLRPTDKAHIPEELRGPVAKVLESINLEGQYTVDPETGKRTKNGGGDPTKRTQAFLDLKQKYADINENGGDIVIDPTLLGSDEGSLDAVIAMGDTRLADMTSEQLGTVWQVVKAVEHSVSTAGKLLAKGKYERTSQWADALKRDTATRRDKRTLTKGHMTIDLENPYTFFSHFGQAGKDMYRTLRDAQDRQQVLTNQVAEAAEKVVGGDGKKANQDAEKRVKALEEATRDYTTEGGQKLTLSTAQVMELYELMKREQAREHLLVGGIVQPEIRGTKVRRGTEAVHLTTNDLADITGTLTAEEKRIADGLQKIASTILSDMGNEASMTAYGYKKFTEPDYWPIRSAREGLHSNIEKGGDNARSIKNIGMAQATKPHANNQVDIGSIFDTFARHAGDMVDYAAWLVPMEDLNRVYNYQYRDGEGNPTGRTVKGILDAKGGEGAQKYWQDLMEDIQNGIKAKSDSAFVDTFSKGVGKFKASAVGGNIRVIVQQPTAIFRAAAVMNPADMAAGLVKGATKGFGWQKAKKYSPIAMRKDAGGFDISSPGTMKETLFGRPGVVNKVNDFMGLGAGAADAFTWGKLWNASEWQVARQHKELTKGSKAFYEEVNRVFTDMIDQTQVVDGILQRSNIMRTSNAMGQQATSFMGEPIMSLNLTMRAWDQLRNEQDPKKRGKAIKNFGRALTALTVTAAANAVVQSLVDAMRDDDKDKKYWERFWSAFTGQTGEEESPWDKAWAAVMEGNFGSNLNPAGQIPYIKDIQSMIQGYDVSRTELSVIQDLIENGQNFIRSADGHGAKTQAYALNKLLASAAKVFGLPVANLERDLWAGYRTFAIETGNLPLQYEMEKAIYNIGSEKNKSRFTDLLYRALESGDMDTYQTIHDELMNTMGVDGAKLESAMKSRYKDRLEKDPAYSIPQESYDLLGIRPQVSGGDDGDSAFGPGDLDAAAYQAYATQRAEDYREAQTALSGSPIFRGMDQETQDTVLRAAYDLAQSGAMMDNGGGEYEYPSSWLAQAPDVEAQGIEPWEYALWRGAQSSITDTKGADGKTVKGQSKKDHLVDWLEGSGLSADQQEYLWGTAYTTDYDEYRDELAEYRSYGPQMDAAYEEMSSGLADNPIFTDMDAELREKVTNAALEASEQMAKMEAVDGYEYETQWIAKTGEAEDRGIAPEDYVMWHVVCGNTYSDRDANGNEIPGQRKQDHLRAWLRGNVALSESQKLWLWRQQYKSLPF